MVIALGALAVKVKALGVGKAAASLGKLQKTFGNMHKKMKPALQNLQKEFGKLGAVAGAALYKLIAASPRLRAEFELLNIRVNQLLRGFGDELAPIIRLISDLVKGLTDWFHGLPEPVQKVIEVTGALAVIIGVATVAVIGLTMAASPLVAVILLIAFVIAVLYVAWEENFLGIKDITTMVFNAIKPLLDEIKQLIDIIVMSVLLAYQMIKPTLEALETVFRVVFLAIGLVIIGLINGITAFVSLINDLLTLDIGNILNIFGGLFKTAFDAVLSGAGIFIDKILGIFSIGEDLKNIAIGLGNLFLSGLETGFNAIWDGVSGIAGGIWNAFTGGVGDAFQFGADFLGGFADGLTSAADGVGDVVGDIADGIGSFFGGSLPEKGRLKNIVHYGLELGETYVKAIGAGVERGNPTEVINRTFNIENINLDVEGGDLGSSQTFLRRLDSDIRQATRI